jgi:NADH dehydrogenase [ubiquinone] 1 alpha subcomplex assembly factor 7
MTSLAERIHRAGPVPFATFLEAALYDPETGFFATGHGAGRAGGDFVTSPEVGPLFGACMARALDQWWHDLGDPDPFVVMEAGAGSGRLCREVLRAAPACAPALRYVLVERSAALRDSQRELLTVEPFEHALGPSSPDLSDGGMPMPVAGTGPIVSALEELPALTVDGVVIANELLDNLGFDLVERSADGWLEIRVGVTETGEFYEVPVPASEEIVTWLDDLDPPVGARIPVQRAIEEWIDDCATRLRHGVVVVLDYAAELEELAEREWLRTYRAHGRGGDPLDDPGSQDITTDVLLPTLRRDARRAGFTIATESTQAEWLRALGIEALVEEGRAQWEAGAARGDLDALAGRSRINEAAALTDPAGLGAHTVLVLKKNL